MLDNTHRLTNNLASLDVQGTLDKVNKTLDNAQAFTEKLNSNKGTLGLLMNDTQLYDNMNATMRNADSLVIDLRQHPKQEESAKGDTRLNKNRLNKTEECFTPSKQLSNYLLMSCFEGVT